MFSSRTCLVVIILHSHLCSSWNLFCCSVWRSDPILGWLVYDFCSSYGFYFINLSLKICSFWPLWFILLVFLVFDYCLRCFLLMNTYEKYKYFILYSELCFSSVTLDPKSCFIVIIFEKFCNFILCFSFWSKRSLISFLKIASRRDLKIFVISSWFIVYRQSILFVLFILIF